MAVSPPRDAPSQQIRTCPWRAFSNAATLAREPFSGSRRSGLRAINARAIVFVKLTAPRLVWHLGRRGGFRFV